MPLYFSFLIRFLLISSDLFYVTQHHVAALVLWFTLFLSQILVILCKKKIKVYTPMPFWNKYPFYLQLVFIIITNNRMDLINHSFLSFINLAELLSMKGCCRLSLHCWSKTTNDWLALSPQGDKTCIFIGRNVLNNQKTRNMKRK